MPPPPPPPPPAPGVGGPAAGPGTGPANSRRSRASRRWIVPTIAALVVSLAAVIALAFTQGWLGINPVASEQDGSHGADGDSGSHRFMPSDLSADYREAASVTWQIESKNIQFDKVSDDGSMLLAHDYDKHHLYNISGAEPREIWSGDCGIQIQAVFWGNNVMCAVPTADRMSVASYKLVDGTSGDVTPLAWTANMQLHCVAGDVGIFSPPTDSENADDIEGYSADGTRLWNADGSNDTYLGIVNCSSKAPVVMALAGLKFDNNVVIPRDGAVKDSPAAALLSATTGTMLTYGDKFNIGPLSGGGAVVSTFYDSDLTGGTMSAFDSRGKELWSETGRWLFSVQAEVSADDIHQALPQMSQGEWDVNLVGPGGKIHVLDFSCDTAGSMCMETLPDVYLDGKHLDGPTKGGVPVLDSFYLLSDGRTLLGSWKGVNDYMTIIAYDLGTGKQTMTYNLWVAAVSLVPVRKDLMVVNVSIMGDNDYIPAVQPRRPSGGSS